MQKEDAKRFIVGVIIDTLDRWHNNGWKGWKGWKDEEDEEDEFDYLSTTQQDRWIHKVDDEYYKMLLNSNVILDNEFVKINKIQRPNGLTETIMKRIRQTVDKVMLDKVEATGFNINDLLKKSVIAMYYKNEGWKLVQNNSIIAVVPTSQFSTLDLKDDQASGMKLANIFIKGGTEAICGMDVVNDEEGKRLLGVKFFNGGRDALGGYINNIISAAEKAEKKGFIASLKSEAEKAAYRLAAKKIVEVVKVLLIKSAPTFGLKVSDMKTFLGSSVGTACLGQLAGQILNQLPDDNVKLHLLGDEMRVESLAIVQEMAISAVLNKLLKTPTLPTKKVVKSIIAQEVVEEDDEAEQILSPSMKENKP